jgi:ankyrin repeat protein
VSSLPIDLFKQAVFECDAAKLGRILGDHPELRTRIDEPLFHFDSPAIVQAAGQSSRPVIEVLIAAGADINERSQWWAGGFGVLDSANPELAAYLIQQGATVDVHAAARLGMLEKLRELVSSQPGLVRARGGDGKTPLHFAGAPEIAEYLLEHGADIDALDIDHESTAAQHLVQSDPGVVRYLIHRGCHTDILMAAAVGDAILAGKHLDADPECIRMRVNDQFFPKRDPRSGGSIYIWTLGMNRSPHQVARKFGHAEVLELLMNRSPADVQLANAFAIGDESAIKSLLASHPDPIQKLSDADRRQICHAAQDNDAEAVRLMLEYGWPVDGGQSQTPLHWAAFHGNAEMARAILRHNPPLEQRDPDHHGTPLGWAIHGSEHGWFCKTGHYAEVVEALLQAGAKPTPSTGGSEAVKKVLRRHSTG